MTTEQQAKLKEAYKAKELSSNVMEQVWEDIYQTAHSMGVDATKEFEMSDLFWDNYNPEDDGNEWILDELN